MQSVRIGKCKLQVETKGCVDCGTEYSSGWHEARTVYVRIGNGSGPAERVITVTVSRCDRCERGRRAGVKRKP